MRFHTVLVVDDYEQFRRLIRLTLSQRTDLRVIGEASDGAAALEKAQELQPDLILMDLGLPKLNGMEATRRLRKLVPHARILIVSQERSSDVVHESLRSGAAGYVHKPHLHSDLLLAIDAVLRGERFVGSGLEGELSEGTVAQTPHHHEIIFYSDEAALLDSLTRFIATSLRAGNPAIVIATKSHLDDIRHALNAEGVDVDGATQKGTYVALDEAHSFSTIMVDGLPVPARFFGSIGGLLEAAVKAASAEHPRVAFCGEGIGLLWAAGKTDAAIRLEQLCNNLAKKYDIDMLCAYPLLDGHKEEPAFKAICAEHAAVSFR